MNFTCDTHFIIDVTHSIPFALSHHEWQNTLTCILNEQANSESIGLMHISVALHKQTIKPDLNCSHPRDVMIF